MSQTTNHNQRIANMAFATVYPLYVQKVTKKGRTKQELDQVIEWLTGLDPLQVEHYLQQRVTFAQFFEKAKLNPNAKLITGVICGYRVEKIQNPLTQKVRYLDKLVDELARGKKMDKILRQK